MKVIEHMLVGTTILGWMVFGVGVLWQIAVYSPDVGRVLIYSGLFTLFYCMMTAYVWTTMEEED